MKNIVRFMTIVASLMVVDTQAQAVETKSTQMAKPTKIAFLDTQAVMSKADPFKEDIEKAQAEFEKRVADLQKQKEDFNNRAKTMTQNDRELAKDLAKKKHEIDLEEQDLKIEMQKKEQEMYQKIGQKVEAAIKTVRVAQGWNAIVPKVFDVDPDFDVTNAVAEQINKEYKKEKAAAKLKKDAAKTPAPAVKP